MNLGEHLHLQAVGLGGQERETIVDRLIVLRSVVAGARERIGEDTVTIERRRIAADTLPREVACVFVVFFAQQLPSAVISSSADSSGRTAGSGRATRRGASAARPASRGGASTPRGWTLGSAAGTARGRSKAALGIVPTPEVAGEGEGSWRRATPVTDTTAPPATTMTDAAATATKRRARMARFGDVVGGRFTSEG
jgi:hypothetical protein